MYEETQKIIGFFMIPFNLIYINDIGHVNSCDEPTYIHLILCKFLWW